MQHATNPVWENPFLNSAAQAAEVERRIRALQSIPGGDYSAPGCHTVRARIAVDVWKGYV